MIKASLCPSNVQASYCLGYQDLRLSFVLCGADIEWKELPRVNADQLFLFVYSNVI